MLVRRSFHQKYYQILMHGKFPTKKRKLLLVGPPDSGKTSWFAPFQSEYYIHFNTFKVMLSTKISCRYFIVFLECYNRCLLSFSCDFKCLLTDPNCFSKNSSKQGLNGSLWKCWFFKSQIYFLKLIYNEFDLIYRCHTLSAYF